MPGTDASEMIARTPTFGPLAGPTSTSFRSAAHTGCRCRSQVTLLATGGRPRAASADNSASRRAGSSESSCAPSATAS